MIYSLIPAKVNSSKLPGKNTITFMLKNKPLMQYTIEAINKAGYYSTLFTDENIEIFGNTPVLKRPPETCLPESTMKEVVKAFIDIMKIKQDDVILLTYLTCPFRTAEDIKDAINLFKDAQANSLQSLTPVNYRPYGLMRRIPNSLMYNFLCLQNQENFYQRQNTPTLYKANGAIYIFKVSELDKLNNQMFNDDTIGFALDEIHGLDIDTELDFMLAEKILERRQSESITYKLSDTRDLETECDSNRTVSNFGSFKTSTT